MSKKEKNVRQVVVHAEADEPVEPKTYRVVRVDEDGNEVAPVKPVVSYKTGRPMAWSARVDEDTLAEEDAKASADVGEEEIVHEHLRLVPTQAYELWRFESMAKGMALVGVVAPTKDGWSIFMLEASGYDSPEEAAEAVG